MAERLRDERHWGAVVDGAIQKARRSRFRRRVSVDLVAVFDRNVKAVLDELPEALVEIDRGARASVLRLARPVVTGITRVLPRQANLFAFAIEKPRLPDDLQPWMRVEGDELRPDPAVVGRRYGTGE